MPFLLLDQVNLQKHYKPTAFETKDWVCIMSLGRAESVQTFQRQISTDVPIIAIGMIDSVLSLLSVFFGDVDNSDYSINIIIIPVLLIIVIISIYIKLYTFCHHCWKDLAVAGAISKHCCDVML